MLGESILVLLLETDFGVRCIPKSELFESTEVEERSLFRFFRGAQRSCGKLSSILLLG